MLQRVSKLMYGVVGIEIAIDRLEGKLEPSQDEDMQDRYVTVKGLQALPGEQSQSMAGLVLNAIATGGRKS